MRRRGLTSFRDYTNSVNVNRWILPSFTSDCIIHKWCLQSSCALQEYQNDYSDKTITNNGGVSNYWGRTDGEGKGYF